MKLPNKAASAVSTPAPEPEAAPVDDALMDDTAEPAGDAPFDKTPFDANVVFVTKRVSDMEKLITDISQLPTIELSLMSVRDTTTPEEVDRLENKVE